MRFVIVHGLPYLLAHGKTYSVRWDEKSFTVGAEVKLASVPARTFSALSVQAKCAGHLDSISAPGATQEQAEHNEVGPCPTNAGDCLQSASVASAAPAVMADKDLEEMTLKELKVYAEAQGIDLSGLTKKADILSAIKAVEMT